MFEDPRIKKPKKTYSKRFFQDELDDDMVMRLYRDHDEANLKDPMEVACGKWGRSARLKSGVSVFETAGYVKLEKGEPSAKGQVFTISSMIHAAGFGTREMFWKEEVAAQVLESVQEAKGIKTWSTASFGNWYVTVLKTKSGEIASPPVLNKGLSLTLALMAYVAVKIQEQIPSVLDQDSHSFGEDEVPEF